MRAFFSIIKKEWLAMSRDIHGLIVLFVMPAVFILAMSLAMRDAFKPAVAEKIHWTFFDADNTPESAAFLAKLPAQPDGKPAAPQPDAATLERTVTDGRAQIGVLVKPGFGLVLGEFDADAKTKNAGAFVTVLAEPGLPPALATAFHAEASRALSMQRMRELMKDSWPQDSNGVDFSANTLAGLSLIESRFAQSGASSRAALNAVQQSVPAWLVFAMFFVVVPISTIFIVEKQQSTLQRLHTLRVPVWLVLAGKVTPFYIINLVQTVLMMLVGHWLVPLCGGDTLSLDVNWAALWLMASAVSLAAIGFALAVASIVRTTEQATTIGAMANILFGAIGGVMVPKIIMPEAMQKLTVISPMSWGMEGFQDVFARGAGFCGVLVPAAALLALAAAGLSVAWWRLAK